MAGNGRTRSGSASRDKKDDYGQWCGYVWCELSDDEKLQFAGWMENCDQTLDELLADRLMNGRRVSLRYDADGAAWCVVFMGTGKAIGVGRDKCYGLTAWRPTLAEAAWLAIFKDVILFKGDWGGGVPQQRRFDW